EEVVVQRQQVEAMSVLSHREFLCAVFCVFVIAAAIGIAVLVTLIVLHRKAESAHAKAHESKPAEENLTVSTNLGPIVGVTLQVLDKRVVAFYNVPYAQPPPWDLAATACPIATLRGRPYTTPLREKTCAAPRSPAASTSSHTQTRLPRRTAFKWISSCPEKLTTEPLSKPLLLNECLQMS
ncbi:hypothetical protein MTO96_050440, partial [Rhipicephalus appendiculatus]